MVAPPPSITVSEWADRNRKLSTETAAEPGQWRTARAPYQEEIMDSINQPDIEKVVVMSSSQVGKSEIINNIIGYYIDCDPGPMLLIQPTLDTAQDYSKRRISTMIRDCDTLTNKVSDSKSKDSNNTILMKNFPGGFLAIGGANSPAGLASRPIRILLADEIDRYPDSAGSEGDPLNLAEKRTSTFWNKKKMFVSTPTIKDASRIEDEYNDGTRERWMLECPACREPQFINLYNMQFKHSKDAKGNHQVWDVEFPCSHCGGTFDEFTWKAQKGRWVAENPTIKGLRSFRLNAFVSPWSSWVEIIKEWLTVKNDPERYKVFKNTVLGESWEEKGEFDNEDFLWERREDYNADLPEGVLLLTCGVDVQDDCLEYEVVGWGRGDETWGIEYGMVMGSPENLSTWQQLEDRYTRVFRFQNGRGLIVACACVDSGGHFTSNVYQYCKKNEYRRVYAIKGQGGPGIPLLYRYTRTKKEKAILFILGVDDGKSKIMSRLRVEEPGDGYCHFPRDESRGYTRTYFKGLISEKLVRRKSNGQIKLCWVKTSEKGRNEPFDVRNYATAAKEILKPNYDALEDRLKKPEYEQSTESVKRKVRKRVRGVVNKGI